MDGTVSRAFDLAKNRECRSVYEIETRLTREGHINVHEHLLGKSIRLQLGKLIKEERAKLISCATAVSAHHPAEAFISTTAVEVPCRYVGIASLL